MYGGGREGGRVGHTPCSRSARLGVAEAPQAAVPCAGRCVGDLRGAQAAEAPTTTTTTITTIP